MTPLVIAFTPNYFVPAATMLRSLLDSSGGEFKVICLVTEAIPQRMQDKLERLGGGRLAFDYIELGGRMKDVYTDPRYSEAASFRLLLPEILPDYDKVAYIDCDVIVRQDIAKLYDETDLGDNYLAAVYEAPIEQQAATREAIGCDPRCYFNSGFLLMNLTQMRKEKVSARLLDACRVDYLEFPDQDALNQVCKGRVLPLSPLFNGIRTFFLPQYKVDFVAQYPEDGLWDEVQRSANIHYTGGKPWNLFSVKFGEWWRCYDSLPSEIKEEWQPDRKIYTLSRLYSIGIGKMLIEPALAFYRKLRYKA